MADTCVAEVGGRLFQEEMQYVCLSQCVNVCTLLNNVSACMGMSVMLCVHMYECVCVCTRAAVSGGAKWASTESRKDLCS